MRRIALNLLLGGVLLSGAFQAQAGVVLRIFYDEITGETVEDLVNAPHFPNGPNPSIGPLFVELLTDGLDTGPDTDSAIENFGTHIRGFIEIPMDGDYRFFLASDDPSELWMADPSTPSDVGSTNLVAFETECCTQVFTGPRLGDRSSGPMTLSKGDRIYFETLHKEITGDEFISVGWEKPDGTQEIIPGYHLAPFPLNGDTSNVQPLADVAPEIIDSYFGEFLPTSGQPQSVTVTERQPARFTATYLASHPVSIQWQKDGEDIPGATLSTYFIPETTLDDDGSQYTVTISNESGEVTSSAATLSVTPDTTAPDVAGVEVGIIDPNILTIEFTERVSESSATDTGNYSLNNDATVQSAELQADGKTVVVTAQGIVDSQTGYELTLSGVEDRAASPNAMASTTVELTLFPGGTILADSEGRYVVEAEEFGENTPGEPHEWVELTDDAGFSGESYMRAEPDDGVNNSTTADALGAPSPRLDYQVSFNNSGTHTVWARGWADAGDDDSLHVGIDGDVHTERIEGYNPRSEWVWTMGANPDHNDGRSEAIVDVPTAGLHTVNFWMREDGHRFDKFIITDDTSFTPSGMGPDPSPRSQAEPLPDPEIVFTQPPQDQTGIELKTVTFNVEVNVLSAGEPVNEFIIHWVRDGEVVGGGTSFTTEPLSAEDDGSQFQVLVRMPGLRQMSDPATLTVQADEEPPAVVSIDGTPLLTSAFISFDEPITGDSANVDNFTLTAVSDGSELAVNAATLLSDQQTIRLDTAEQESGARYDVAMQNIADVSSAGNAFNGTEQFIAFRRQAGGLTALYYEFPGGGLDGFYPQPRGVGQYPDNFNAFGANIFNSIENVENRTSGVIRYFESPNTGDIDTPPPSDVANNYGQVIFGWIVPTETADYSFHVATDDNSELYLSTDADPANAVLIANEPDWTGVRDYDDDGETTNHSDPITLQAGQEYYVEIIMQEGGGGDNLAVAWTTDGSIPETGVNPIPGEVLHSNLPVFDEPVVVSQDPSPDDSNVPNAGSIRVILQDGESALVDQDSIELTVNGQTVNPTVSKDGNETTIEYAFDPPLAAFENVDAELTYADTQGGGDTISWSFQAGLDPAVTFVEGTRFIETEDWNYDSGQWVEGANGGPTGEPYAGGEYQGLEGTPDVDYSDGGDGGGEPLYRYAAGTPVDAQPGPATVDFSDPDEIDRGTFDVESNWKVGWTAAGEWMNYTRDFPEEATTYDVFAHISSGGDDPNPTLQLVTGDPTQPDQEVEEVGEFSGAASGDWGTAIFYKMHAPGDPATPAPLMLSGINTIRLTIGGNMDVNYLAFVPTEGGGGNGETPDLSVSYADGTITLEWTGTLEAADAVTGPYEEVSGATSPMQVTPDEAGKFWRSRN